MNTEHHKLTPTTLCYPKGNLLKTNLNPNAQIPRKFSQFSYLEKQSEYVAFEVKLVVRVLSTTLVEVVGD